MANTTGWPFTTETWAKSSVKLSAEPPVRVVMSAAPTMVPQLAVAVPKSMATLFATMTRPLSTEAVDGVGYLAVAG